MQDNNKHNYDKIVIDTVKYVVHNADIWKNKKVLFFLNRMKYIEGSLMKSSGNISKEH